VLTHKHTQIHRDEVIAIAAPPYYVSGEISKCKVNEKSRKKSELYVTRSIRRRVSNEKKMLRETQTLRAGCGKAEPKFFAPSQTPFPTAKI